MGKALPGWAKNECGGAPVHRATGGAAKANWISGAIQKPGSLRKALRVPEGETIPAKKLDKAAHSASPTLRKRANLAKTLKGFK